MSNENTAPHILIVDDSTTAQKFLERILSSRLHYPIVAASNVADALSVLETTEVGLIILDHLLENELGLDLMRVKRKQPKWNHIPVLVITGTEYENDIVVEYIEYGAVDFLPKKLNIPVMMARILQCLRTYVAAVEKRSLLQDLEQIQKRNAELIKNTLPVSVYNEIIVNGEFKAREFDDTTVLFADVCNFTQFTNLHSSSKLVGNLNQLVRRLEQISDKYELCKIKTIGDAYMAVGGVLDSNADVASTLAAAEEMIAAVEDLEISWHIRVGVASGSLIGGIVGDQRMQFDVWGGSVNLAARMCACAKPSTVATPHASLPHNYNPRAIEETVTVNVKGFGDLDVAILRH